LGTSKQLSIGPDALGSLLVALLIADHNSHNNLPQVDPALLAHLFAFLVGLFLLILGLLRVGFLDNVISRPLLAGFVNAVAFTILMEQWDTLFGLPPTTDHSWHKILYVIRQINLLHWPTFVVGATALIFLFTVRLCKKFTLHRRSMRWLKFVPETMVAVVIGIIVSQLLHLDTKGVRILGDIPRGFPTPSLPFLDFATLQENLLGSIVIAIVGFVESIIVAKMYGMRHNTPISPNRELVALGAANCEWFFQHPPTHTHKHTHTQHTN
jgi:MFS superfamily sulfate permease-like transporter